MTVRIPLRSRAGEVRAYALIDDTDSNEIGRHRWCLNGTTGYAVRGTKIPGTRRSRLVLLHRQLMGLSHGDERQVDHINRNRLDNRRENLRIVTIQQQRHNMNAQKGSTSRHRGVSWNTRTGRWVAQMVARGEHHFLGYFEDEELAAEAVAACRREQYSHATD